MLYSEPNKFHFSVDNFPATPGTAHGTSVTPGASNVWGAWAECLADTVVTTDLYLLEVSVTGGATAGQDKSQLLDIGIDASGGTTYVSLLGDTAAQGSAATKGILVGNHQTAAGGAQAPSQIFPLRIPSGAAIAARVQGSNSTAGTVRVAMRAYGKPSRPEAIYTGQAIEIVGAITNSQGVTVAPGNGAYSAWTSLGTTTRACKWWQLATQLSDNDQQAINYYWELGVGDGTNMSIILRDEYFTTTGELLGFGTTIASHHMAYCPVPAGATMYARAYASGAPDTTWTAVAVGVA